MNVFFNLFNSFHNYLNTYLDNRSTRPMIRAIKNNGINGSLTGCEIGTLFGVNALNILKELPIKRLYLGDPYTLESTKNNFSKNPFEKAKQRLRHYSDKICFVKKYSHNAIGDIPDGIDFVYVDGGHEYSIVKKDIELYYPKVKSGGFIGGHDINRTDVNRAVVDFFNSIGRTDFHIFRKDWWAIKK